MTVLQSITNVVVWPSTVAHELTHAVVAWPWADRVDLTVTRPAGENSVHIDWREGVARWQVAVASLAPFLTGILALVGALVLWVAGGFALPESGVGLAKLAIVAMWWTLYVIPSPDDIATALHGGKQ